MYLSAAEMGYFVEQAVKGLISFGFNDADAKFVNDSLNQVFNKRCAPAIHLIPDTAGPQRQSICIAPDCSLHVNNTCSVYDRDSTPAVANATLLGNYTKDANGHTGFNISATTAGTLPKPTSGGDKLTNRDAMNVLVVPILLASILGLLCM
jgi:hypothetical protein